MARPSPETIREVINRRTNKKDEILAADAIWAIFYEGRPINIRTTSTVDPEYQIKYRKVSFSNQGHAENLAKKLNRVYNTTSFEVYKLTNGERIKPGTGQTGSN